MRLTLTAFLFCLVASFSVYAEESPKQPNAIVKDTETGEAMYMVYAVTGEQPVAFREKPNNEERVLGYFPPRKAVWVVRPQSPWVFVYFKEVTGWVKEDDLLTFFTIDPVTGIPQ